MIEGFKKIRDISWNEIWENWKSHEGSQESWQQVARDKGWENWEAWRGFQADFFKAPERKWELFEIINPSETVPQFRMGPFKAWQEHFEEKNVHSFFDMVRDHYEWVQTNDGIQKMLNNFPDETQLIGIFFEDDQSIYLFEGHHRCAAISLAVHEGKPLEFITNPTIAITRMNAEDKQMLAKALETGSEKK